MAVNMTIGIQFNEAAYAAIPYVEKGTLEFASCSPEIVVDGAWGPRIELFLGVAARRSLMYRGVEDLCHSPALTIVVLNHGWDS